MRGACRGARREKSCKIRYSAGCGTGICVRISDVEQYEAGKEAFWIFRVPCRRDDTVSFSRNLPEHHSSPQPVDVLKPRFEEYIQHTGLALGVVNMKNFGDLSNRVISGGEARPDTEKSTGTLCGLTIVKDSSSCGRHWYMQTVDIGSI